MVQRWGKMELHNSRYGSSNLGFFSMNFMKCRHATKSWESGHRQRCVILSYNRDYSFPSALLGLKRGYTLTLITIEKNIEVTQLITQLTKGTKNTKWRSIELMYNKLILWYSFKRTNFNTISLRFLVLMEWRSFWATLMAS